MPTDELRAWFMRVPTDLLFRPHIMDTASATDWRVLLSICRHQGWKAGPNYRKTFKLAVAKTAEEARCSRRAALRSIRWWREVGVIKITKRHRMNVYEIVSTIQPSPVIGAMPRHKTPKGRKKGDMGRFVPSAVTDKVPAHGTGMVPAHGTPNQKSSSEVFSDNPSSAPPTGGNGRAPETVARPCLSLSETTLKELEKTLGRERLIEHLRQGDYPIPEWLLIEEQGGKT